MIELKRLFSLDNPLGSYVQTLLVQSFPPEERRELKAWEELSMHHPDFFNNVILKDNQPIGLISYWNLSHFTYVEHLAIDPEQRGNGLGKLIINTLCETINRPIVLEVERPNTDIARRRIAFYERCGFKLWGNSDYLQPPYRRDEGFLPLYIMAYGNLNEESDFPTVKKEIHWRIYNHKSE